MATKDFPENTALREPAVETKPMSRRLLRRIWTAFPLGLCWIRLLLFDGQGGLEALVAAVVSNQFFRATQIPSELTALGEILTELLPDSAMEIGTYMGGTLFFLTRLASPRATILSVDLPGGRFGGGYGSIRASLYRRFARSGQRLHTLRGNSHSDEMFGRVRAALGSNPLDYLFIDGDHTYAGVKQDFELYSPLVRKGGVIAFHDIVEHPPSSGCEVSRFWNEIKANYSHREIVAGPSQKWGGIGVLYLD